MSEPSLSDYWNASYLAYGESQPGYLETNILLSGSTASESQLISDQIIFLNQAGISGWTPIAVSYKPSDGFYGVAFLTSNGQIMIAFEGTVPGITTYEYGSLEADNFLLDEQTPAALSDALAFTQSVISSDLSSIGTSVPLDQIYVTGHSLGGTESEYVAEQLSLSGVAIGGGVAFGGTGVPGYTNNDGSSSFTNNTFTTYVDYADPIGNYASGMPYTLGDGGFAPFSGMAHYGSVVMTGYPYTAYNLYSTTSVITNSGFWTAAGALLSSASDFINSYHLLTHYAADLGLSSISSALPISDPYIDPDVILADLELQLGTFGQSDLSQITFLGANEIETPHFTVIVNEAADIVTITQNGMVSNDVGLLPYGPGTDVITLSPSGSYIESETNYNDASGTSSILITDTDSNSNDQSINFSPTLTRAVIENVSAYDGTVYGFSEGDTIELGNNYASDPDLYAPSLVTIDPSNELLIDTPAKNYTIKLGLDESFSGVSPTYSLDANDNLDIFLKPSSTIDISGTVFNYQTGDEVDPLNFWLSYDSIDADAIGEGSAGLGPTESVPVYNGALLFNNESFSLFGLQIQQAPNYEGGVNLLTFQYEDKSTSPATPISIEMRIPYNVNENASDYLNYNPDAPMVSVPEITPSNLYSVLTNPYVEQYLYYSPEYQLVAIPGDTMSYLWDFGVSDISTEVTCFVKGTKIMTPEGERPIEDLSIGDTVITPTGHQRVKFVGESHYDGRFIGENRKMLPVCIASEAIAPGVPSRDLLVSPGHCLLVDGVLVPVGRLVNGLNISQMERVEQVSYYHIELEGHDIIYAEGCPTETFYAQDDLPPFHNEAEFFQLYPEGRTPCRRCAELVESGYKLERIEQQILSQVKNLARGYVDPPCVTERFTDARGAWQRVEVHAWAQYLPSSLEARPVDLVLSVGGEMHQELANYERDDLRAAGIGDGRHALKMTVTLPDSTDLASIIVCVALNGQRLPFTTEALKKLEAASMLEKKQRKGGF